MQRCAALCLNIERQSKWPRTLVHRFTLMQLTPTINNSPGLMRRYATHIVMNGGMYLLNEQWVEDITLCKHFQLRLGKLKIQHIRTYVHFTTICIISATPANVVDIRRRHKRLVGINSILALWPWCLHCARSRSVASTTSNHEVSAH